MVCVGCLADNVGGGREDGGENDEDGDEGAEQDVADKASARCVTRRSRTMTRLVTRQ